MDRPEREPGPLECLHDPVGGGEPGRQERRVHQYSFDRRSDSGERKLLRVSKQSAVERAARAAERFGSATDAVDAAAADLLGVNRTDLRILGVVAEGALTA